MDLIDTQTLGFIIASLIAFAALVMIWSNRFSSEIMPIAPTPPVMPPMSTQRAPTLPAMPMKSTPRAPTRQVMPPTSTPKAPTPPAMPPASTPKAPSPPEMPPTSTQKAPSPPDLPPTSTKRASTPPAMAPTSTPRTSTPPAMPIKSKPRAPTPLSMPPSSTPRASTLQVMPPTSTPKAPTLPAMPPTSTLIAPTPPAMSPTSAHGAPTSLAMPPKSTQRAFIPPAMQPTSTQRAPTPPTMPPTSTTKANTPPATLPSTMPIAPTPPTKPPNTTLKVPLPSVRASTSTHIAPTHMATPDSPPPMTLKQQQVDMVQQLAEKKVRNEARRRFIFTLPSPTVSPTFMRKSLTPLATPPSLMPIAPTPPTMSPTTTVKVPFPSVRAPTSTHKTPTHMATPASPPVCAPTSTPRAHTPSARAYTPPPMIPKQQQVDMMQKLAEEQEGLKTTQSAEIGRKVIVGNFVALKKYMHPDPIIKCQTGFNLLTVTDRRNIEGKDITEKNEMILRKVISKGDKGYIDFKERLRKTWQTELLKLIIRAENGHNTKEIEGELEEIAVLSPEYIKHKGELKDGLIELYKTRHSKVFLSPLFEEKDTPLASFYIRPELRLIVSTPTKNDEKIPVKSLSEIFTTDNTGNREIYVIADAGIGKTAFSKYLANVWCQAHYPDENMNNFLSKDDIDCMQEFGFLFLVLLRDSDDLCSIDDLIFQTIVSSLGLEEKLPEHVLLKILKNEKCLVILDGLDEWTHPDKKCFRKPRPIPHRNDRKKCTIMTTTRPWKLGVLKLNSWEIGKKVELTKLSRDSAYTLTRRILLRLKSHPSKDALQNDVKKFMEESNRRKHTELTSVPLLLIYTICLWCDGVHIGNSKCGLYVNIVELLLSRTIQKHGELEQSRELSSSDIPECFAEYDNCRKYYQLLMHIGKLAYFTLFGETKENTLAFDGSNAGKYLSPDEMKLTLHSGILSESTSKTLTKKCSKVSFSHKTVQEFFSAIFISSNSDAQKTVVEQCKNVQDILDMSKVCEFICYINAVRMCAISNDLMSVVNTDKKTLDYRTSTDIVMYNEPLYELQRMFMSCLQEMPECENFQLCLQDFFIDRSKVHSEQLKRLLKQNKTNLKSLHIDTSSLRELIDSFCLTDFSHIQKLYYNGSILEEAEIDRILFPSLQALILKSGIWTNDEEHLSKTLTRVQNLQYLYIDNFMISHKILDIIFNFISDQKSMKELTLENLDCITDHGRLHDSAYSFVLCDDHSCYGRKRINLDFPRHSILSKIYLKDLSWRLQLNISTPSLVDVSLWNVNLDDSSLFLSPEMLEIERVWLQNRVMSAGSLENFVTVLENLPQSVTVEMFFIIPETAFDRFRENIRSSQSFHVIEEESHFGSWIIKFKTIKPNKE